jgi:hypothetical protein
MESSLKIEQKHLRHSTYMTLATATAGAKTCQFWLRTLPSGKVEVRSGHYSDRRAPNGKKTGGGSFRSGFATICDNLDVAKADCLAAVEK